MYPIQWITNTGWDLNKYLPEKEIEVTVVANTPVEDFRHTDLNIFLYSEPPDVIPRLDRYVLENWKMYDAILAWDSEVKLCPNVEYFSYLDPWITEDFVEKEKEFKVTFLSGTKRWTYGHKLRQKVFNNQDKLSMPKSIYNSMPFDKNLRQELLFSDSQYNICIENSKHLNYFTEKILDCFLTKTIPIYYGCPNIEVFFYGGSILTFDSEEELYSLVSNLDEGFYDECIYEIEANYQIAKSACKDLGEGGYKQLDRKIDSLIRTKI